MKRKWIWLLVVQMFVGLGGPTVGRAQLPFADDFEAGFGHWTAEGLWGGTTAQSFSPGNAVTDSPGRAYANNTADSLRLTAALNFSVTTAPALRFYHQHELESGYDFGLVEASTDGAVWQAVPGGTFTGNVGDWNRVQLDLSGYTGQSAVYLRFKLSTDVSVIRDGWYVDDVYVGEAPIAPVLSAPVVSSQTLIDLSWSAASGRSGATIAAYRIYRSLTPGVSWQDATLVAEVDGSTLAYSDISVAPKSTYHYQVMALDNHALHALGAEQSATTPAGMDFPLLDTGEAGPHFWQADAPWALSDERALSPTHAWTDSPGGTYSNSINAAITLSAPLDLTGTTRPALVYRHQHEFNSGDSALVEASANGGTDWTTLASYTGVATGAWERAWHSLDAFKASVEVLVRFRIISDTATVADGWTIDEIGIGEAPAAIDCAVNQSLTGSHEVTLNWGPSADPYFDHYAVFYSKTSGQGLQATHFADVADVATTTLTVTGLDLDTDYYFRVYAVSAYGVYSPDGFEATEHTLNHPLTFTEDFEAGLLGWNLTGTWGIATPGAYAGTYYLTDSPLGSYEASSDSWAQTAVDLTGTTWPVLRFWDRYDMGAGDWARVEVSVNGTSYTPLYGVGTGYRAEWREQVVDLSPYKNEANLRIRFRVGTDYRTDTRADGWAIDEVRVEEHTPVAIPYPYFEDFEAGAVNWLASAWGPNTNGPYSGLFSWGTDETETISGGTQNMLVLGGEVDLSGATYPQLTYWLKAGLTARSYFRLHVSSDGGVTWPEQASVNVNYTYDQDWTRYQADLSAFAGQTIRLRFYVLAANGYTPMVNAVIDNVSLQERTLDTSLHLPVPYLKSVDLSWDKSSLAGDFKRYEIYRDTSPNVTLADTLVGSFTDIDTLSMIDTGLSIGQPYYYRLFVVDARDTYSAGFEQSATTVPLNLPVTDPMEDLSLWDATGTWGIESANPHGGSASLSDSPGVQYEASSDSWILTAVNLTGTTWPVLRFWDRYDMGAGDWARVEVSVNGTSYTPLYGVGTGYRAEWREQVVDLSPYKNEANLRIRFRVGTDYRTDTRADGWAIDDVQIAEHTPVAIPYPYFEDFEAGAVNWLASAWGPNTNGPYSGLFSWGTDETETISGGTQNMLVLGGEVDLSGATYPQLTYWLKAGLTARSYFRLHVSSDGGVTWPEQASVNVNYTYDQDWTRYQADLSAFAGQTIRLRFYVLAANGYTPMVNAVIDNVSLQERTLDTSLHLPVPYLKSVDLSWDKSSLAGDFKRYEIYRDTSPNVTLADTLVGSFTDIDTLSMTDTGLSIGQPYYYRLFVVDARDTYSAGFEQSATTVPLNLPVTDPMEDLSLWDATGTWGIESANPHGGSASLSDSPGVQYEASSDSWILTAVNLTGTTWPVLRFWDRYDMGAGDWARVEVSVNGTSYTPLYGVGTGYRAEWREQVVDLSPYKNEANLRIRFRVGTDYRTDTRADGWAIDDVQIAEHTPVAIPYPYFEDFEAGAVNWLASAWGPNTNGPYRGLFSWGTDETETIIGGTQNMLVLGGEVDLSGATYPQLTYWLKAGLTARSYFRLHVSSDGGVTWPEQASVNVNYTYDQDWTRYQADLSAFAGQTIRLRFYVLAANGYTPMVNAVIDNVSLQERTPDVVLYQPVPGLTEVALSWDTSPLGADFRRYEIYRDTNPNVTLADTLVGSFTDSSVVSMTDTNLSIGQTYYYRLFVVDVRDTYSLGAERNATTVPLAIGFNDPMETMDRWVTSGTWGVDTSDAFAGSASISDSPGVPYAHNTDTVLLTALNLTDATWPILSFHDTYDLGAGDWLAVEVSTDGNSWQRLYVVYEGYRTHWLQHQIDLSPWKGQANLRVRFRMVADNNTATTGDGWMIDEVFVGEHAGPAAGYPVYDDFERGLNQWLHASWQINTNEFQSGGASIVDGDSVASVSVYYHWLVLGRELDLSAAVSPRLSYWMKGRLSDRSYFRVNASVDGGVTWNEIAALNVNSSYDEDWTQFSYDLSGLIGPSPVRLRLGTHANRYTPDVEVYLDNIGVGEPTPGSPVLVSPLDLESVGVLQPMLVVSNAIDYQSDALNYRFEVYGEASLSTLVASVPAVAQGNQTTAWTVDINLADNNQYWWRVQASDAGGAGPWSSVRSFYINHINLAPLAPTLIGPPSGSILPAQNEQLTWHAAVDPDAGDWVAGYQLQVARDIDFIDLVIDDNTLAVDPDIAGPPVGLSFPLLSLDGAGNLSAYEVYYWRVRGYDNWSKYGAWSPQTIWFYFGIPAPSVETFSVAPSGVNFKMKRTSERVYLEFSTSLTEPDWQIIAGPMVGTNLNMNFTGEHDAGFYRFVTE